MERSEPNTGGLAPHVDEHSINHCVLMFQFTPNDDAAVTGTMRQDTGPRITVDHWELIQA